MRTTLLLALLLIAAIVAASPAFAVDTDTENSVVGGTIPELCQLRIAGTVADLLTLTQDGSGEAAYDAGFINSAANATVLTIDANTAWVLSVTATAWAANGAYTKPLTDLLLHITNAQAGTDPGGYVAGFVSPPAATDPMLTDAAAGVSNREVRIQTRVALSWADDIPGIYSTTLVYTLAATIP
jgi:hypothetical protein